MTSEKPVLVAYRREWPERADVLVAALGAALGGLAERIDHIGSTAIPGMTAKDVLDLQASAPNLEAAVASFDARLAALGFERSPYEADHVPAGRTDDPGRWAKRLWLRRGHRDGDVNLHLRRTGSPNARLALLFRDWFRAHPEAVPSYCAFKLTLAGIAPDTGTYSDVKDPVVDLVIAVAEAWAAEVGWAP